MKLFTKNETRIIITIFSALFLITSYNMSISLRKGRDSIRKNDFSALQKGLDTYYQKYRAFPLSSCDGNIDGCFNDKVVQDKLSGLPLNVIPCIWGESEFEGIKTMVRDPKYKNGSSYLYVSDGKGYKLYIALEGKDEAEYQKATEMKNLQCGTKICNYGIEIK